jgi:hypothetical protein
VTFSNQDSLSSSGTRVNSEAEAEKCLYLIELYVRKPFLASISQSSKVLRLNNLV